MRNAKRSMQSFPFADSAECHQKRAKGDSHTAQPLGGGLRLDSLCRLMSTCRQAPVCASCRLRFWLLFSPLSFECFIYFHFHRSLFFFFFFFLAEIPHVFKQKKRMSQYGACIWKNQTQHSCSASLILRVRY